MLIPSNSRPLLLCHWCHRDGGDKDAIRSVKLVNGTLAGICAEHLTTQWDQDQIASVETTRDETSPA